MKILGILTAASLAFLPALASADPASSTTTYERPAAGPVASQANDDEDMDTTGLIAAGGIGALGLILLLALSGDGGDDTTTTTTTTTTQ